MVVGDGSTADANVLALSEPLKPEMHEAKMPDLSTVVDEASLTGVRVNLEDLDYLHLEVEIKTLTFIVGSLLFRDRS